MVIKGIQSGYGISQAFPVDKAKTVKPTGDSADTGKFVGELVNKVNDLQVKADSAIQQLATGEAKNLHEVMLAVEKSGVSFQFLTQVRNKALEAYQEIMRMQV
jgi:flagellar hook-basal body complex protein FliE